MVEQPFTPYWRHLGTPAGPNSWVFFVVARIAGTHRPIAVVSSVGDTDPFESLQGYPLTGCCRRIITILADPTNHTAIRAELALATSYYAGHDNSRDRDERRQGLVELPELDRRFHPARARPWDRTHVPEFPFIATCLVQGVAFDPYARRTAPVLLEPLATVYRDSSVEWGMVVIDITEPEAVRYGIVGFTVDMAKFVPSREAERRAASLHLTASGPGVFEVGDGWRIIEDSRPRRAMSAAEYMAKFGYEAPPDQYSIITSELLAQTPLIDATAMSLVWPPPDSGDNGIRHLSAPNCPTSGVERTNQGQSIAKLIQGAVELDHLDESILAEVRSIPDYRHLLRHSLVQEYSDRLHASTSAKSIGLLIRLAFADNKHLGLEQLNGLSDGLISAAWRGSDEVGNDKLTSVSFCIDRVRGTPAQLADMLSQFDTLSELYLLQSPGHECDTLSLLFLQELAARPPVLSRTKIMLAGTYSSALRKRFWLPAGITISYGGNDSPLQSALLDVFPVQQILVRHGLNLPVGRPEWYFHHSVSLHDGLLKPERFAAGFLVYLSTLLPDDIFDPKAQVFSFSSCPASLAIGSSSAAEVSPILAENFTLRDCFSDGTPCSPVVRDLVPRGWTVIVSQEICLLPRATSQQHESYYIRYAFVRARRRPISVDHPPPLELLGADDLHVVGLEEFLAATAPEVDRAVIGQRLGELQQGLAAWWGALPSGLEPLSVLTQSEAARILLQSLSEAQKRKRRLYELIQEGHEEWDQYAEILTEKPK